MVKNPPANAGGLGSIPQSGRFPGEGNGNPLQYSCLVLTHLRVTIVFHWLKMGKSQSKNQSSSFPMNDKELHQKATFKKPKGYKLRNHLNDIPKKGNSFLR